MRLIMFNTIMGVAAGLGLMLVPRAWAQLHNRAMPLLLLGGRRFSPAGWAGTFATLGLVLFLLGFVMTVFHPLSPAAEHIDTLFGEPNLVFGILPLAAAWYLLSGDDDKLDPDRLRDALAPIGWLVASLGVVLLFAAAAIARFTAVGGAPREEPITGLLHDSPQVENLFFAVVLYGLSAVGCLVFPAAAGGGRAFAVLYWSWTISGFAFALFSALNFYTHTGMLINMNSPGPDLRW